MPYINGKRVTQAEWAAAHGNPVQQLFTSPRGENPAPAPVIDEETGAPESKPKKRAGTQRSQRSEATVAAAVADALGTEGDA